MRIFLTTMFAMTAVASATMAAENRQGPPPPHGRDHRGPQLTDEQRACLEGKLGKPGEGERPSHEEMESAFSTCNIQKPEHPTEANISE